LNEERKEGGARLGGMGFGDGIGGLAVELGWAAMTRWDDTGI